MKLVSIEMLGARL